MTRPKAVGGVAPTYVPQHFLNLRPLPQEHGALRSGVSARRSGMRGVSMAMRWCCRSASMPGSAAMMRSEEHTSELQSLMRTSYAVFCLKKKNKDRNPLMRQHDHKH